jgi:hypothetical protein
LFPYWTTAASSCATALTFVGTADPAATALTTTPTPATSTSTPVSLGVSATPTASAALTAQAGTATPWWTRVDEALLGDLGALAIAARAADLGSLVPALPLGPHTAGHAHDLVLLAQPEVCVSWLVP